MIISPCNGDIVGSTIELTYALEKGTKGDRVQALSTAHTKRHTGKHQIMVTVADHDHALLATSDAIEIEVK
ncbi:hypothetical protein [Candidatus Nitrospira neomarina]|uniref:Uncharacterized protein n=1 Tax=Candidatus Nitrospira neomarina TaxID=3020899 RepID=A0AA96K2Z8_9BACT|nr:hypothetical protein [Candidatus Nitrospira neomarina]WNM62084.1 hypothetical protein PQG83_20445 [Candidatus Nitrospira neomarina]